MKQGFDNEMDSLLRRQSRAAGVGAHGDGKDSLLSAAAHLDADELSAFAENALPAAARGVVALHLADCDECRGHAVVLARAAGVEAELEKRSAAAAGFPSEKGKESFWRAWLGSLLSPRVLRYAVPVLALSLVGVVSFVALRSRQDGAQPARQEVAESNAAPEPNAGLVGDASTAISPGQQANQTSPSQPSAAMNSATSANTGASGSGAAQKEEAKNAEDAPAPAQLKPSDNATASSAGPQAGGAGGTGAVAAAPPPAPQPLQVESRDASRAGKKDDDKSREDADEVARVDYGNQQANTRGKEIQNLEQQTPDGSRGRKSPANNAGRGGDLAAAQPPKPEPRRHNRSMNEPRARSSAPPASAEGEGDANETKREEQRTVAGHSFRRQGGAWVDVKYKSSMSSTGVRRGSEAFRALVADIPEIGRVAEHLGGEVIVVVGGRAYRIR